MRVGATRRSGSNDRSGEGKSLFGSHKPEFVGALPIPATIFNRLDGSSVGLLSRTSQFNSERLSHAPLAHAVVRDVANVEKRIQVPYGAPII